MKICKFLAIVAAVTTMYVAPALAEYESVIQTGTDLGPNARPCSFAFMQNSGWVAILRTDTAYAHAMLVLKSARDNGASIGFQLGAGISACSNLPSLTWLSD